MEEFERVIDHFVGAGQDKRSLSRMSRLSVSTNNIYLVYVMRWEFDSISALISRANPSPRYYCG